MTRLPARSSATRRSCRDRSANTGAPGVTAGRSNRSRVQPECRREPGTGYASRIYELHRRPVFDVLTSSPTGRLLRTSGSTQTNESHRRKAPSNRSTPQSIHLSKRRRWAPRASQSAEIARSRSNESGQQRVRHPPLTCDFSVELRVELRGFEPLTFSLRWACAAGAASYPKARNSSVKHQLSADNVQNRLSSE